MFGKFVPRKIKIMNLKGKNAIITGGGRGLGRGVAQALANEGVNIGITGRNENYLKIATNELKETGVKVAYAVFNVDNELEVKAGIESLANTLGGIDILVNNAALHWESQSIEDISTDQLTKTFHNNFFSYFWTTKYAMPYLEKGASIINTTSVTAYRGSPQLIDYASTKGAIVAFTRSLSANLIDKGIRVNAVAPGPIWTPLIASSFDKQKNSEFGSDSPMKRAGMPNEVAPSFLFLATDDSSFISGQVLHPNGGEIVNG